MALWASRMRRQTTRLDPDQHHPHRLPSPSPYRPRAPAQSLTQPIKTPLCLKTLPHFSPCSLCQQRALSPHRWICKSASYISEEDHPTPPLNHLRHTLWNLPPRRLLVRRMSCSNLARLPRFRTPQRSQTRPQMPTPQRTSLVRTAQTLSLSLCLCPHLKLISLCL